MPQGAKCFNTPNLYTTQLCEETMALFSFFIVQLLDRNSNTDKISEKKFNFGEQIFEVEPILIISVEFSLSPNHENIPRKVATKKFLPAKNSTESCYQKISARKKFCQ